ncbi:MAG: hypothetical protein N2043_01825 [Ignavibacterium sp.]|nr:hypothetical protein [Ignavibacterium sp.]
MDEKEIIQKIETIDNKIKQLERDLITLETEYKNAQQRQQEIIDELQKNNLPTDIHELWNYYLSISEQIEEKLKEVDKKLKELENPFHNIKTLEEGYNEPLPF